MDASSMAALTTIKLNSLTNSTTQRTPNLLHTTLISQWPSSKPNMAALYAPNSSPRNRPLSLTRCSTKPDTNKDNNVRDEDSTSEPDSNGKLSKPLSIGSVSSSSASISSLSSSSAGMVFDLGRKEKDSWDIGEIGSPVVKRFLSDDEERWYMWYYGRSDGNSVSDSIGLAVSSNGVHWERGNGPVQSSQDAGLVMKCSKDWWAFDTMSIRPCEVVVMSSSKVRASSAVYWLYYTGYSSEISKLSDNSLELEFNLENPENFQLGIGKKIFKSLPGLAISQDGRHWARIEGEHHSGALFDVGVEGDWDSLFISSPQVVFHGSGDLRMYYHSFDVENRDFGIGIARSRDGMKWVKLGKIIGGGKTGGFDEFGVMNPSVVKNKKDGKYVMAYEGIGADGKRSIGLAVSPDGLKEWRRFQEEVVLKPSMEDGWDNEGVGSPCLVQLDGEEDGWRLYYAGFGNGGRTGIGMAVSDGSDLTSFKRSTPVLTAMLFDMGSWLQSNDPNQEKNHILLT